MPPLAAQRRGLPQTRARRAARLRASGGDEIASGGERFANERDGAIAFDECFSCGTTGNLRAERGMRSMRPRRPRPAFHGFLVPTRALLAWII
jgi:hypothetical protein